MADLSTGFAHSTMFNAIFTKRHFLKHCFIVSSK